MAENLNNSKINIKKEILCDTDTHKCPNCGYFFVYSPKHKCLFCEHCDSKFEINVANAKEIDYRDTTFTSINDNNWKSNDLASYRCNNCGAVSIMEAYEVANKCPFCGISNIVQKEELDAIKPNGILPFVITEENAEKNVFSWVKKRVFTTSKFKKALKVDKMKGIYIPCWTYDLETSAQYHARLYKIVVKRVGRGKNAKTVTKKVYFNVSGVLSNNYDDYLVEASNEFNQKEILKLGGFKTNTAKQYDNRYLAGFSATRYNKTVDSGLEEVKKDLYNRQVVQVKNKHNADGVDTININTVYHKIAYKHILLPIWIYNFKYRKKTYRIAVNGENGVPYGKTPKSPIKIGIVSFFLISLLLIIAYFILTNT